jgi:hypothetical protein
VISWSQGRLSLDARAPKKRFFRLSIVLGYKAIIARIDNSPRLGGMGFDKVVYFDSNSFCNKPQKALNMKVFAVLYSKSIVADFTHLG